MLQKLRESAVIADFIALQANVVDQLTEFPVGLSQQRIHIIQGVFMKLGSFLPGGMPSISFPKQRRWV